LLLEADAAAPVDTFLYDLRLVPSGAVQRNVDLETTLKRPPEGLQLHPPEEASYRIVPGGSSRGAGFADALGVGVGGRGEGRGGRGGRGGGNVSFHVNFNDSAIGNEGNDGIDNNNNNNINNINNNDDDNDDSISSLGGGGGPRRLSDGTAVEVKAGAGHGWERVCEVAGSRRMSIAHAVDTHRNTPLHLALKHRCGAEIVGLLLAQEGADAHAPNDDAMTPIHLAVSHRASPDVSCCLYCLLPVCCSLVACWLLGCLLFVCLSLPVCCLQTLESVFLPTFSLSLSLVLPPSLSLSLSLHRFLLFFH
jgi:hypothetical protein